jgi:hypothetical protein
LGLLCALLFLLGVAAPARAGFVSSSVANTILGEFNQFVLDYNAWNAENHNLPLLFLEITPTSFKPEMVVLEWWLWMIEENKPQPSIGEMLALLEGSFGPLAGPINTFLSGGTGTPPGSLPTNTLFVPNNPPGHLPNDPPGSSNGGSGIGGSGGNGVSGGNGGNGGSGGGNNPHPAVSTPEPSALALLGTGAFGLLSYRCARWRSRRGRVIA